MIASLLIFQGYSNGAGNENHDYAGAGQIGHLQQASEVSQLVQGSMQDQRQALAKQVQ